MRCDMTAAVKQTIFLADGAAVVRSAVGSARADDQPRTEFHAAILEAETVEMRVRDAKLAVDAADYRLHLAQTTAAEVSRQFAAADPAGGKQALLLTVRAAHSQVDLAQRDFDRAGGALLEARRWAMMAPAARAAALAAYGSVDAWAAARRDDPTGVAAREAEWAAAAAAAADRKARSALKAEQERYEEEQYEEQYEADLELALQLSQLDS